MERLSLLFRLLLESELDALPPLKPPPPDAKTGELIVMEPAAREMAKSTAL